MLPRERNGSNSCSLITNVGFSEEYVFYSQEGQAFSLLQQFFFRANLGKDKRTNVVAGVLFACLVSRMSGLNELLLDGQVFSDENKEVSLSHLFPPIVSETPERIRLADMALLAIYVL